MKKRASKTGFLLLLALLCAAGCGKSYSSDSADSSQSSNGAAGSAGNSVVSPSPGSAGDSYLRFDVLNVAGTPLKKLLIYFNNNKSTGSVASPFYMASFNGWAIAPQTITDSTGWGRYELSNVIQPREISLMYGGDYAANSWAANIKNSSYYDPAGNNLKFCISNNAISQGPCAGAYEAVKLVSSVRNADLTYTYTLGLRSDLITFGSKDAPFVMGEFNNWATQLISDADGDGYYEAPITTFNREIKLNYGGKAGDSWADISKSAYYDTASRSLIIDFANGALYSKGGITNPPAYGTFGDDFVRFTLAGTNLTVYLNNNKVSGSLARPFYFGSQNLWASPISQTLPNTSGWGNVSFDVGGIRDLYFIYGGDDSSPSQTDWSVAPITGSVYYNAATRYLCINISGSIIMACQ